MNQPRKLPRPLPSTPRTSPEPVPSSSRTVSPSSFYGSKAPPKHPSQLATGSGLGLTASQPTASSSFGSSHTRYRSISPPSPFREPELVSEEPLPDFNQTSWGESTRTPWENSGGWAGLNLGGGNGASGWGTTDTFDTAWSGALGPADFDSGFNKKVLIDGRTEDEEKDWWDPAVRARHSRPGPGMLPPLLEERLHNPEHTLYSVSVAPPDLKPDKDVAGFAPPSADEVRTAVPHPNSYYCRRHNGWVLLLWRQSLVVPQLSMKSFVELVQERGVKLPDQERRKMTGSCVGEENPLSGGPANKTHHFHHYPRVVNAQELNPPFRRRDWEQLVQKKLLRRRMTVQGDFNIADPASVDKMDDESLANEPEGDLLDLYMCCQCSVYCVVSPEVIPGVIPLKWIDEFVRDRRENPMLNGNADATVVGGLETFVTVIENKLWKANDRGLPVMRPAFRKKLGWNNAVQRIFEAMGFVFNREEESINPPVTNPNTPEGRSNRSRLLRAWVELSVMLVDYRKRFANGLKNYEPRGVWVKIENTREMYQNAIGAHVQQIPRGLLPDQLLHYPPIAKDWEGLGMTPTSYSWELLQFAYLAQCRCDPAHTMEYFTYLCNIVYAFQTLGQLCPQELQNFVIEERSRGRFTQDELQTAATALGFGQNNRLRVDFEADTDDEFIKGAWRDALREAWKSPESASRRREVQDALMVVAQARGSRKLMELYSEEQGSGMTPERAYSTLEVPADVDEEMLITVFLMRVEERPHQMATMRDAMNVIAEVRDSSRLKQFLETGKDPGVITPSVAQDMPRGLNQLGNTCYLNSLLQYFYTIKDLREAVLAAGTTDVKSLEDGKLTEDDLKRHRVGGRLVTKREIIRSKKFVHRLSELFWELEYSEAAAVTPSIELAKLALVTSKDEEEDNGESVKTESSNDTDATLVEDAPVRYADPEQASSPSSRDSPSSVLGKRPRNENAPEAMEMDSPVRETEPVRDDYVMVKSPRASATTSGTSTVAITPEAGPSSAVADKDGDVEMVDEQSEERKQPPPLPPRKSTAKIADSGMMFGRQHDVSECMDNCMFQIETALLKFDELTGSEDDKTSVVKRLFYGKIRQRLTASEDDRRPKASVHEKEDLFSHLPVNVSDEGYDIYDGLSGYFDDIVEFDGKKARMEVSLVDLPPLLQIQLQRVQFNRETLQPYKSQAYVKFGETVYMDRFMDSADPQKKARSKAIQFELDACRDQIHRLTQGKHVPYGARLAETHEFLTEHPTYLPEGGDDELLSNLKRDEEQLQVQIDELRARAGELKGALEAVWAGDREAAYELTSVFIHRGTSPSWGHYFFYSRYLPDRPDEWFKYNDSSVSAVGKEEVLRDTTGDTANPYLLVFMRKDAEVVHTVKRFDPATLVEEGS
ncbi:cysteine proteinase [Neolentinus lepideus HHB14362 ss-1]|uniref:ubiquitinyl hydrolase 1 n=1 Tax=Neolentinus lepideus HHB14362 ss-1 TaxID=1314782 RepID=A0A165QNY4_9AGAM|nr:cysteine proteinase [Neolentinus lepideus HHB14362 ss-1]